MVFLSLPDGSVFFTSVLTGFWPEFCGSGTFCMFDFWTVFFDYSVGFWLQSKGLALNYNSSEAQEQRERLTRHLGLLRVGSLIQKRQSPQRFFGQRSVCGGPLDIGDRNLSEPPLCETTGTQQRTDGERFLCDQNVRRSLPDERRLQTSDSSLHERGGR